MQFHAGHCSGTGKGPLKKRWLPPTKQKQKILRGPTPVTQPERLKDLQLESAQDRWGSKQPYQEGLVSNLPETQQRGLEVSFLTKGTRASEWLISWAQGWPHRLKEKEREREKRKENWDSLSSHVKSNSSIKTTNNHIQLIFSLPLQLEPRLMTVFSTV